MAHQLREAALGQTFMKLTFKRRDIKDLQQLATLVEENVDAIEPGLKIIGSNLNLGRASIELVALDTSHTPVLVTLGLTADDTMLLRALEAYAWCLDYPESLQKLVPASRQPGWPPRVVFVAERLLESFVRKMRLLRFSTVDFFEFRYVEANGTMGFYLDRADWDRSGAGSSDDEREDERPERPGRVERPVPRLAPTTRHVEPVAELEEPALEAQEEEEPQLEAQEEPEEEREVVVHGEPVAVEEPTIVMLHEPKPAPRLAEPAPRVEPPPRREPPLRLEPRVEPAPRVEPPRRVGPPPRVEAPRRLEPPPPARADPPKVPPAPRVVSPAASNDGSEPADDKVVLKGLRVPTETPRGRPLRDLPHVPVKEAPAKPQRESVAPTASTRPARVGTSTPSTIDPRIPRIPPKGAPVGNGSRNDTPKIDAPKIDAPKIDAPKPEASKSDLAPTWRKFLDRLTGTFEARPATPPPAPRASAPASAAPEPFADQPFTADLHLQPEEVAPDEVIDESQDPMTELSKLKGLTLPDNGELAPQWRKFLDHPTLDEAKIAVVRGYLQREFPLCTVYDFYDFQRNAQVFQLQDNHGKVTQLITMTAEFFDSHRELEIRAWIEKHRVAHAMRQAGQSGVLVSQAGLQIEQS
jgi:hypothetical protein